MAKHSQNNVISNRRSFSTGEKLTIILICIQVCNLFILLYPFLK